MGVVTLLALCYVITSVNCQEEEKYPADADFYIGGLFSVYGRKGEVCSSDVYQPSIKVYEAARWTIDQINSNKFLPGELKLGLHGMKTCGVPEKAAEATISLLNRSTYKGRDRLLFGILSPIDSTEAKVVSQIISYLPKRDRIPMISYGATSASLNNRDLYMNFFRVIPSDLEQVKVMIQVMLELKWNYVGIIYEEGAYGEEAASELAKLAKQKKICIPLYKSFKNSITGDVLDDIISAGVKGMVYIGSGSSIDGLLLLLQQSELELIVSESLQLQKQSFKRTTNYYDASKGALVTSSPREMSAEFSKNWMNVSGHKYSNQSWINLAHDHKETSVYSHYIIKAVCTLAHLIKTTFEEVCPGTTSVCDALKNIEKQTFIDNLDVLVTNLTESFPFIYPESEPNIVKFDEHGQYEVPNNSVQYELYNFQKCSSDYCFTKVGELRNDVLLLNKSSIKMYDTGDEEYDPLPIAQCPANKNCDKCIPSNFVDDVLFIEGDFYVIGVVPIFAKSEDNSIRCPIDIRTKIGADMAESIRFAVDEINRPNGSFVNTLKGYKIGLVILSGCESPIILKEKILRLHKGSYELKPGLYSNKIQNKILGYVGSIGSSLSIAIAETLSHLGIIQVAIASTSPTLSDRSKYPHFMRIPTADDQQSRVILEIMKFLDAKYIQVLHSKGSYGEGALNIIKDLAVSKGICVANSIEVVESSQVSIYNKLLPELRKHPYAKVVVSFIRSHVLEDVIVSITESMIDDEFVFVASETWGRRESLLSIPNKDKIQGSISVSLELPLVPEFSEYLKQLDENNPWIQPFWETHGSCIFAGSFERKNREKACNLTTLATQDPWAPFAIAATYSVVTGVMNTPCIEPACPASDPETITKYMYKNVKLSTSGTGEPQRVFDDNGDGVVKYTILRTSNSKYNVIGHWSKKDGLTMDNSIVFPKEKYSSACPNDFECNKCYPDSRGPSPGSADMVVTYVLIALVVTFVLISIVLLVVCCRLRQKKTESHYESHYTNPDSIKIKGSSTPSDTYLTAMATAEDKPQPCTTSSLSTRNSTNLSDPLNHCPPGSPLKYTDTGGHGYFEEQVICSI